MDRVLPRVCQLVAAHPDRTIFTRFIPAEHPGERAGTWRRYYEHWSAMTIEKLGREMIGLVLELATFVPPATVVDKRVYSPWYETDLHTQLQARSVDALVMSGGETDVCVLTTVLGAVDRGYRVILFAALRTRRMTPLTELLTAHSLHWGDARKSLSAKRLVGLQSLSLRSSCYPKPPEGNQVRCLGKFTGVTDTTGHFILSVGWPRGLFARLVLP